MKVGRGDSVEPRASRPDTADRTRPGIDIRSRRPIHEPLCDQVAQLFAERSWHIADARPRWIVKAADVGWARFLWEAGPV